MWTGQEYMTRFSLPEDGKVNCCPMFSFLMNDNEFKNFLDTLFEEVKDCYVINYDDRIHKYRYTPSIYNNKDLSYTDNRPSEDDDDDNVFL